MSHFRFLFLSISEAICPRRESFIFLYLTGSIFALPIAGAGLDVFEKEPIGMNDELLRLGNVVLVPHIGSASMETRSKMARMCAEKIRITTL